MTSACSYIYVCSLPILCISPRDAIVFFFFFNDTATTEIYTLSLHDALPISRSHSSNERRPSILVQRGEDVHLGDRKSTRLNSSHSQISYAVFCLKKKKKKRPSQNESNHSERHKSKRGTSDTGCPGNSLRSTT